MSGGAGNDIYYVDNAADKVNEAAGQGTDTAYASVSYALQAGQQIEFLRANAGATGLILTGNEFNNTVVGGAGTGDGCPCDERKAEEDEDARRPHAHLPSAREAPGFSATRARRPRASGAWPPGAPESPSPPQGRA